jgi:hypothetical protein
MIHQPVSSMDDVCNDSAYFILEKKEFNTFSNNLFKKLWKNNAFFSSKRKEERLRAFILGLQCIEGGGHLGKNAARQEVRRRPWPIRVWLVRVEQEAHQTALTITTGLTQVGIFLFFSYWN